MQRCPVCNSRKFHGNKRIGWKCYNCRYENIPQEIIQETNNDKGIIESSKPSNTIINSSLFQEIHDLHNNAYKFRIIRDNPNLNLTKQSGFKGNYFIVPHELKIRKSKNWLVIYNDVRNKVPLKNLDKTDSTMLEGLKNIALEIGSKYSFEIDTIPILFSKNRPEVKTPFLSANNFYEEEAKAVYPLPSPIELQGKNAVKNSINLSAMLEDFRIVMEREIQNKQLHQSVLIDMKDTLKLIQQNGNHVSFFSRLKKSLAFHINSLRLAVVKEKTSSDSLKKLGGVDKSGEK